MNSCSCIFSEENWDEVVTRCDKCQYIFDNYEKIQKEEKVKRSGKKKQDIHSQLFEKVIYQNNC
jgi:hypothetical protein